MRKALALGTAAASLAGMVAAASPASAACTAPCAETTVTFTAGSVAVPTIAIVASPATVTSGTTSATATIPTVVTDTNLSAGSYVVKVRSTDFGLVGATTPSGTALVPASSATVYTGQVVPDILGTATVSGEATSAAKLTLSNTDQDLMTVTRSNANVVAYTATVDIDTTGKAAGAYTGTVTQSVV